MIVKNWILKLSPNIKLKALIYQQLLFLKNLKINEISF